MPHANPAVQTLLDITENAVSGFALRERIATSHVLLVQDGLAKLEAGAPGATLDAVVTIRDAAGRAAREVRLSGVPHTHDGRPSVLLVFRDETTERRLVRTLVSEEARLSAVLDAWDDAVLVIEEDASGPRVRFANRAFISLFTLTRAELAGTGEADVLRALRERGDEGVAAAACLAASSRGPANDTVATSERSLALWAAPLSGPQGALPLRMLAVRDVTAADEVKRAQGEEAEQWRKRHESVVASYANLSALHEELSIKRQESERLNAELRTLDGMKSELHPPSAEASE